MVTIRLVNTSIISRNYVCVRVSVVKTFKIYSLNTFQVYIIVLLTIVTILYVRSPELVHLITGSLYPLTSISPFPPPPAPGNHQSSLPVESYFNVCVQGYV